MEWNIMAATRTAVACAGVAILLALAGCASLPPREPAPPSPCDIHEASWECQIQRYHDISQ